MWAAMHDCGATVGLKRRAGQESRGLMGCTADRVHHGGGSLGTRLLSEV
jgi:hypothetical protein